ncbi:transcription factor bHLH112-like [Neltuma alba]|uniref:transcription factor bHLH112-like n=1 Tax=Neltuma alba TaxID=207710 RepID=UPI0010A3BAD5|nr:transcription factor bHLH112-like [Prosopis alba]
MRRNAGNLNQIVQEAASRSRDSTLNSCMIQNLEFRGGAESWLIKEEMCTETLNDWEQHYRGFQESTDHLNCVREKPLLNTLASSDFYSTSAGGLGASSRGYFSQIHPTINISNLNHSSPAISRTSSDMRFNASSEPLSSSTLGADSCLSLHLQNHVDRSSTYSSSTVGKEKVGDRIAALQQLVAPFGKTDTASVLMEAIGYIKFLQSQVETLSVPYMKKSSRNQNSRAMQRGWGKDDVAGQSTEEDLRSRGLCLVPLSRTSTAVWHPDNL